MKYLFDTSVLVPALIKTLPAHPVNHILSFNVRDFQPIYPGVAHKIIVP